MEGLRQNSQNTRNILQKPLNKVIGFIDFVEAAELILPIHSLV